MDEILSLALESGLWAALFCFLFLYMLKDSRSRETKYTTTIDELGKELGNAMAALKTVEELSEDCKESVVLAAEIKGVTEQIRSGVEALRTRLEKL